MKDENIDKSNFRKYAKEAVKKYKDKDMLADAFFWSFIVGLYEESLQFFEQKDNPQEFHKNFCEKKLCRKDCPDGCHER